MIKNCYITDIPQYGYDIKYNDEVIARAELLNIRDKQMIFQDGKNDSIMLIMKAVKTWEFADNTGTILPITPENIALLKPEYFTLLANSITEAELATMAAVEGIEKN